MLSRGLFFHHAIARRLPLPVTRGKSILSKKYMPKALDFHAGPLVWIDCEMTGLDVRRHKIIEIAVLITDGNLEIVDRGIQFVVRTEKKLLDGMDEWCTKQHSQSGLTQACLTSPYSRDHVSKAVLEYIKKWIPQPKIGVLAGNSVHADRSFLIEEMPEVVDWLHYRIVDVSSIKELSRRWYPDKPIPRLAESTHRALDDIRGSIKELQWYRKNIFLPPSLPPVPNQESSAVPLASYHPER